MFRFRSIELSGVAPFDAGQAIHFLDGPTIVAVDNDTESAAIVKALHLQRESEEIFLPGVVPVQVPDWLLFLDRRVLPSIPYGSVPWVPLRKLISSMPELWARRDRIEDELTRSIRAMLPAKLNNGMSKFSSESRSVDQLRATIAQDGTVTVLDSGEEIDGCFQAVGERVVLYLSVNAAIRRVLTIDVPFVADSVLSSLDPPLSSSCYAFISRLSAQSIILETKQVLSCLDLKPHLSAATQALTNKAVIERVP